MRHVQVRHTPTATPAVSGAALQLPTATDIPVSSPTAAPTATARPAIPTPRPTPAPTRRPLAAPHLISAQLTPSQVAPGASLHAVVSISGVARAVQLYLTSGPGGGSPLAANLSQVSSGTWATVMSAPSIAGTYHYTVGLFDMSGHRVISDNDAWNVQVGAANGSATNPPTGNGPQPLPNDIPLAPPFSYGNPVTAVFSAEGRTVNGSEVVSTARPDVAPSAVSQFYSLHLPRAGWTVTSGPVPAGATSFTIVATAAGNRVCVVQYSASTVQIFYGSL